MRIISNKCIVESKKGTFDKDFLVKLKQDHSMIDVQGVPEITPQMFFRISLLFHLILSTIFFLNYR